VGVTVGKYDQSEKALEFQMPMAAAKLSLLTLFSSLLFCITFAFINHTNA